MSNNDENKFTTTHVCSDTCDDHLLLSGSLHGSLEIGIVPGINFTVALDKGGIGVQSNNLGRKGTIRT